MKIVVDESLSARVRASSPSPVTTPSTSAISGCSEHLTKAVMETAQAEDRVLVSADTDFGELLAIGAFTKPSVVLLRRSPHAVEDQVELLLRGLDAVGAELATGPSSC